MSRTTIERRGAVWLELLFLVALVVLAFQLFPSLWTGLLWVFDIRNWSRRFWFAANLAFVLTVVAIRFGPDVLESWRQARERRRADREKELKQMCLRKERETLERLRRGRAHRIY
jgi:hypothetical protein